MYTDLAAAADEVSPLEVCVVEGEAGRQQGGGQRGGEDPVPDHLYSTVHYITSQYSTSCPQNCQRDFAKGLLYVESTY